MIRQLKYIGYLIVLIGFFSACSHTKKYISNPEEQIARELSLNRIVMLGDFAHEWPLPYHSLISTLSIWLTMIEKGVCDQNNLTLFLEEDEQVATFIRQYLKTGDLNPFLDFILPSTSLERFEFYSDLRRITTRIDSMNGFLPKSRQITFDVQGPEAMNIFDPRILDSSETATKLYFLKDRDSLSAMNIITYLKEHPNQKGLVFYGNGHLIKKIVKKNTGGPSTPSLGMGSYIGYYLKREYSEDQVLTISSLARGYFKINFDDFGKNNVLVLSKDVPWKDSQPNDESLQPENFDAFFIRHELVLPSHPLSKVFSSRIITASIKRLEFLEPHRIGPFGRRFYNQAKQALQFLSDTSFSKVEEWKDWFTTHPFYGLEILLSEGYRQQMLNKGTQILGTPEFLEYIDNLISLGFDQNVGSPKMSHEEWKKDFDKMWQQVVLLNAIGIYWIGDTDERAKAKSSLVEFSHEHYNDPDKYLKWWRNKFFNVTY